MRQLAGARLQRAPLTAAINAAGAGAFCDKALYNTADVYIAYRGRVMVSASGPAFMRFHSSCPFQFLATT